MFQPTIYIIYILVIKCSSFFPINTYVQIGNDGACHLIHIKVMVSRYHYAHQLQIYIYILAADEPPGKTVCTTFNINPFDKYYIHTQIYKYTYIHLQSLILFSRFITQLQNNFNITYTYNFRKTQSPNSYTKLPFLHGEIITYGDGKCMDVRVSVAQQIMQIQQLF